jgi:formylglycine-generating enzyme required for sulfatase activity
MIRSVFRILRGGSWIDGARFVRCANRSTDDPGDRSAGLGVRPVAEVKEKGKKR